MFVNATAWADGAKLKIEPFSIEPGTSKEVTIDLENGDQPVIGFQCVIELPTGLTVAVDEDEEPLIDAVPGTVKSGKASFSVSYNPANGQLVVYNSKNSPYKEDAKQIITMELAASNEFQGGNIGLKQIVFSLEGNVKANADDVTAEVTTASVVPTTFGVKVITSGQGTVSVDKQNATAGESVKITATPAEGYQLYDVVVMGSQGVITLSEDFTFTMPTADVTVRVYFTEIQIIPAGPSLIIKDFRISAKETKEINIELVQGNDPIIGFQCVLDLPEGLSVAVDEEEGEPLIDAVPGTVKSGKASFSVSYNPANGQLVVYNSKNSPYKEDATNVITLELQASDEFECGYINITDIVFSKEGNVKETAAATKTKVNDPVGIADIRVNSKSDIFTLSGTRVRNLQRGLYIVNGKKVVVK
jgi:hypothetical protein